MPGGTGVVSIGRPLVWTWPMIAAADKAQRAVVEIVAVELVDAHADRAGADERVEVVFVLSKKPSAVGHRLVGDNCARSGLGR